LYKIRGDAMTDELDKLKKYLEGELQDLLQLEKKNDLTSEGKGMLIMLKTIFKYMNWNIKEDL